MGLLGSDHFAAELANGGDSIAEAVSSYLNLDMVGRLSGKLVVSGADPARPGNETERANATVGR